MYTIAKHILKSILPARFIFKYEEKFRWLYAFPYLGNIYECAVCLKAISLFFKSDYEEDMCPFCGSLPRHRRLWNRMVRTLKPNDTVLHFSPARCIQRRLLRRKDINYISTDFEEKSLTDHHFDITNIKLEDNSVDIIVCYHVLEHVEDDISAMKEMSRVLKPNGISIIQTPFKRGEIYEDPSITDPQEREDYFGQSDHVRIYSVNGLKNRLEAANFEVEIHEGEQEMYNGLSTETVIIAIKNA